MYIKKLTIGLLLVGLIGCDDLEVPEFNQFVVEGFIIADEHIYDIKVKETSDFEQDVSVNVPITDAIIEISNGESSVTLDYDPVTEKYIDTNRELAIVVGQEFTFQLILEDVISTSSTVIPEKPTGLELTDSVLVIPELVLNIFLGQQIGELFDEQVSTLTWEEVPGRSFFVVIESTEPDKDTIIPSGVPEESQELLSSFRFVSSPSEITSFDIRGVALERYGRHVAKVYSVNEEYVDLFNSSAQDSRDLNEPPSNVTNALGIFSAFAVDSLEFEVRKE